MRSDPWGVPSFHLHRRAGWHAASWHVGLIVGMDFHDGPTLVLDARLAGWWCYVRCRLWYSDRQWQATSDRWTAESLAGEHRGVTVSVTPPSSAPSSPSR